jgi:hypothetical protein
MLVLGGKKERYRMEDKQYCPICKNETGFNPRYPKFLCSSCAEDPLDEQGRSLTFYNVSMSGGFEARYTDTGEVRDSNICYVAGRKCRADEARFGGIVIQPVDE